ncbi:uncharacterized protein LOC115209428 isoform X3 [Octopus sinensis]|uniref:Uncharacterized protein LOC115209428 isoform X3 n=1 Tax=Octopus sinensis TaxID=2607531 RepID=A0A6P7S6G3_9MOLL|nr:uncharacterized protein LOC115209428 isoform X3 [Octopus sinensis]
MRRLYYNLKRLRIMSSSCFLRPLPLSMLLLISFSLVYLVFDAYSVYKIPFRLLPRKTEHDRNRDYSRWPTYKHMNFNNEWFKLHCWNNEKISISNLYSVLKTLKMSSLSECRELYDRISSIFSVTQRSGQLVLPSPFVVKVRKWLGGNPSLFEEAKYQHITLSFNEYTRDNTMFNPLRSKRPLQKPNQPQREYVEKLSEKTGQNCDFCKYSNFTAEDLFGRIESKHSFTAANAFKYDAWHALVITRNHHPLKWSEDIFLDCMKVAREWYDKVHSVDIRYKLPTLLWDLLPHASASQVHPHMHINLLPDRYYGVIENWRIAAEHFSNDYPDRNYFSEVLYIHSMLDLAFHYKTAAAFANITPKKDNEIVVLGEAPNDDFFKLLYYVLRAYIDDMEKLCFSMAIAFPSILKEDVTGRLPVYARLISRGTVGEVRSDISSLELFAASNVNVDPFQVATKVRNFVAKMTSAKS